MQPLIVTARRFGQRPEEFAAPAAGQSPAVPSPTCSDSGVVRGPVHPAAVLEHRSAADPFDAP
ncbi:hypothetical protein [Streptomyces sp. NPDC001809]